MRQKVITLIMCIIPFLQAYTQQLTVLKRISIDEKSLSVVEGVLTTEFLTKKKKSIGQFEAINLNDLLKNHISSIDIKAQNRLVFIAESSDSTRQSFSLADISPDVSPLPALILIRKTMMKTGDTIKIQTKDTEQLKGILDGIVVRRLFLPFANVTTDILSAFQPMSVIFPLDGKPLRWLKDVRFLYVCRLEK